MPDGLPPLRDVIEAHGLSAKKALGQNFLLDLNITRKIARFCGDMTNRTIIEVGPGPGGLTRALFIEGARRVIAIERDERCEGALREIGGRYPGRLYVHFGDAMQADWPALLASCEGPVSIAANLPYGVASQLLVGWLETEPWPPFFDRMVLMFQREVAERIVAEPGSKAYGRLSVLSQWRSEPRIVMNLPAEAFTPPPKVAPPSCSSCRAARPLPPAGWRRWTRDSRRIWTAAQDATSILEAGDGHAGIAVEGSRHRADRARRTADGGAVRTYGRDPGSWRRYLTGVGSSAWPRVWLCAQVHSRARHRASVRDGSGDGRAHRMSAGRR